MGMFPKDKGQGKEYRIAGHELTCVHCGGKTFLHDRRQLNSAGMTFLDLDWASKSADIFVCATCGHIEWFDLDD